MPTKAEVCKEVYEKKIIAILRGIDPGKVVQVANALYAGGITMLEVTFNPKEKESQYQSTVTSISRICQECGEQLIVGAGTVLTPEMVVYAHNAGAKFVITPTVSEEVIRLASSLGMMTMPGAYSATEINEAYEYGADFVKVFPASEAGPAYFKAIRGPLGHIPLTAVGGVNEDNAADFLKAGAVGLGIGGNLVDKKLIDSGDFNGITEIARRYVSKIEGV